MNRTTKTRKNSGLPPFYLVIWILLLLFLGCEKPETNSLLTREVESLESSKFNVVITNWQTLQILKTSSYARGKTTSYFLIQQGTAETFAATLRQLELKHGGVGSLVHDVVSKDFHASEVCPWWKPELQGVGYSGTFNFHEKSANYYWDVFLFLNETNAFFYKHLSITE
jgi:hypothetical protein